MKTVFEFVFGMLAWLCAILTFIHFLPYVELSIELTWPVVLLPCIWVLLLAAVRLVKQKPLKNIWWVWISAPLVFSYWIFAASVLVGAGFYDG